MKYPPKTNILIHFASIIASVNFREVISESLLAQISAKFSTDST
jgi:hypothetical protein